VVLGCLGFLIVPRVTGGSDDKVPTLLVGIGVGGSLINHPEDGVPCSTSGGFTDIQEGAPVVIQNGDGDVIATSSLQAGTQAGSACVFFSEFHNLAKAKFYSIEVTHRGKITKSYDDLAAEGWRIGLTL